MSINGIFTNGNDPSHADLLNVLSYQTYLSESFVRLNCQNHILTLTLANTSTCQNYILTVTLANTICQP